MKNYLITLLLVVITASNVLGQETLNDNGFNLKELCSPEKCKYLAWVDPTYFPFKEDKKWQINNLEIAIKFNGSLLITGDMNVVGQDSATIVQLEFVFVDDQDENITSFKTEKFEFFNEPGNAEPITFSAKISPDLIKKISYVVTEIKYSEIVPYYEINSNCFLPCKTIKLKDEIKAFKKSK